MPSNYESISEKNDREAADQLTHLLSEVVVPLYSNSAHFILELLQNAEDAMWSRKGWNGPKSMDFSLRDDHLRVSHFGNPFSKEDVESICACAHSKKDQTQIGKFGIGFKSVYIFTNRPSIHSGDENFAIENFRHPCAANVIERHPDETVIILPLNLNTDASKARSEIADGLRSFNFQSLLFLSEIEKITWSLPNGSHGYYARETSVIDSNVKQVTLTGQEERGEKQQETWLLFSKQYNTEEGARPVYVEIAFSLKVGEDGAPFHVEPIGESPLFVWFPTKEDTRMGFLTQGPYRLTPGRDSIRFPDPENEEIIMETAGLLVEALRWLRNKDLLDVGVLEALPLSKDIFDEEHKLGPLYDCSVRALTSESLLPRHGGGYVSAAESKLARTGDLRELFSPEQLAQIYNADGSIYWLSGAITDDRAPEIRNFLMRDLDVAEITPERIVKELNEEFLTAQPDDWIIRLYKFAANSMAARKALADIPFVRLQNGKHVSCSAAYLPGGVDTDFCTVRATLCEDEEIVSFLKSFGLEEPDTVADIIENVLPKYAEEAFMPSQEEYESDIKKILNAYKTDSRERRESLVFALKESAFVMSVDVKSGAKLKLRPGEVYMATKRMSTLFHDVEGVFLVDNSYRCFRGEYLRDVFGVCGASIHLQPIKTETSLTEDELETLRTEAGCKNNTGPSDVHDHSLRGLKELFDVLPEFDAEVRAEKTKALWDSLCDLCDHRRAGIFQAEYKWFYHSIQKCFVEAEFIRIVRDQEWVPNSDGTFSKPENVVFEELEARGWKREPLLLEKIRFKPSEQDALAEASGVPPEVIDLAKESGITADELRQVLEKMGKIQKRPDAGDADRSDEHGSEKDKDTSEASSDYTGDGAGNCSRNDADDAGQTGSKSHGGSSQNPEGKNKDDSANGQKNRQTAARKTGETKARPIIARPSGGGSGSGSGASTGASNRAVEDEAVKFIIEDEYKKRGCTLHRMENQNNEGFDLVERGENGEEIRWIEVKSRTGVLTDTGDGAVSMSKKQFGEHAREKRDNYWLYIVENVGGAMKLHRIKDPWGKAETFLLGSIWTELAEPDE